MKFAVSEIRSIEPATTYNGKVISVEVYPDVREVKDLLCSLMEDLGDEKVLSLVQEIIEENK
jgi:hypothetical protein